MSSVNFVQYDPTTGAITHCYCQDQSVMNAMAARGVPVTLGSGSVFGGMVDLTTKAISYVPPTQAAPPVTFTYLQFEALFTTEEQAAIMTAATSNPVLLQWLLRAAGASYISLSDPSTIAGLALLTTAGLLTSARQTAILASIPT